MTEKVDRSRLRGSKKVMVAPAWGREEAMKEETKAASSRGKNKGASRVSEACIAMQCNSDKASARQTEGGL